MRQDKKGLAQKLLTFFENYSIIYFGRLFRKRTAGTTNREMRKCRNWQTSKTKDLVAFELCGFKSHLPH